MKEGRRKQGWENEENKSRLKARAWILQFIEISKIFTYIYIYILKISVVLRKYEMGL